MTRLLCASWFAALVMTSSMALAQAQPKSQPSKDELRAAATVAERGMSKYEAADYAGALEDFLSADRVAHSPRVMLQAARCQRRLQKLLLARDTYRSIVREDLGENAPAMFAKAQAEAADELKVLEALIPTVAIDAGAVAGSEIRLDDRALNEADIAAPVPVDPGPHTARALRNGEEIAQATFEAAEGGSARIRLEDKRIVEPPKAEPGAEVWVPGSVLLGVGTAGLVAGIATRVVAYQTLHEVESRCKGIHCLPEDKADAEGAETMEVASTVCFVAGGVLAAGGITLLLVLPNQAGTASSTSVTLGPGHVAFETAF